MTAKLATVGDRIAAPIEESGNIHDGSIIPRSASDKWRVGGMRFNCGYLSPHFVTDPERMEVAFENAYILIHEEKINCKIDLLPLLEQITKTCRPLLIVAEDVGGEVLATLVVNKLRGSLQVAAVRAPGFGDQRKRILQEIALLTGGKAIAEGLALQLKNIQISDLGQAGKITIDKSNTMVECRRGQFPNPSSSRQPALTTLVLSDRAADGTSPGSTLACRTGKDGAPASC